MIDSPDQVGTVLRKAFELPEPALLGIGVDHKGNDLLFEPAHDRDLV
jgi:hypothetical protein